MKNIIIGTAGHIDHGKTTLIKALTGRDTDTLDEEKRRGISINLGFTYFDLPGNKRVGIVDVPGHEKFIKNMLAGVAGIDIVLLVISCEEGVMPQTVEHLDILNFLNVKKGIVVLTKCENVDNEFKELVKSDIKEKLKGSFLENTDIVEVDSISKYGIDKLKQKIELLSDKTENKNEDFPPRLNIDRVFSLKGFGTIVTGTLIEGKININDELEIYPKNLKAKIRGIQVHGKNVETAYAGQRTAINISNLKIEDIERGDTLALPNALKESNMIDVRISLVDHTNKELKYWDRVKIYHGAKETLCRIVPLDKENIKHNEDAYVQLRLEENIVVKKGDRFIIRTYSPMETIGGGIVIDTCVRKHKRFDENVIRELRIKENGNSKDIIEEYLKNNKDKYTSITDLMSYTGFNKESINNNIDKLVFEKKVVLINNYYLHINQYKNIEKNILNILTDYHKNFRLRNGISKEEIRSKIDPNLKSKDIDSIINNLCDDKQIKNVKNLISLYEFKITLNDKQKEIKAYIKDKLNNAGLKSLLTIEEFSKDIYYKEVLEYMIGKDAIVLDDNYIISMDNYNIAKNLLINFLKKNKSITLGEYRSLIDSSRKNCLIILEHFDRNRLTRRVKDKRVLF
ncbi:selenocysteine-specific translation elongation factor [Romboutsia sp. 1001713B170207_170306_H8]|uniref:selenocysteine-specific translation elongation factor n=2 Tax=unclassified Romboutsia TaxID=2626894 RepID=UPI000822A940|nr:selenocysteine-specific translation elongation factor [Romboutsia sp. 1001713B170207_170306_H8]SCH36340.1 SelB translation factor [uncultured Clostridium sp.]